MTKFLAFAGAIATTTFGMTNAATVADTCVLADFTTATADFIGLNNVLSLVPTLLPMYIANPYIIENQTLTNIDFSVLGLDFSATPSFEKLNVTGLTTIGFQTANVTGSNTLDFGAHFSGELSVSGTFSVEIAQLDKTWYEICWTSFLHQHSCPSATIVVDVALALNKPTIAAGVEANLYQCASGIPSSVCSNMTITSILVAALGGDITSVVNNLLLHFKDASVTSLSLGWDSVTNIDFYWHGSSAFISNIINGLLDYSAEKLNKKGNTFKMTKFFGFVVLVAAAAFGVASAATSASVDDTCVIVDFETATSDFTALNNIVTIVKASPSLLSSYVSDPLTIEDQTLTVQEFSFLGYTFTFTPTINSLNVSGLTTLSPKQINITGTDTLDIGTDFTGTLSVDATFSVEIAQPDHKWYQICWVNLLNPLTCPSTTLTVDVALALVKPEVVTSAQVDMYQCAEGISTSVCSNLTVTSILVDVLSGSDLSTIEEAVLLRLKSASLTALTLGWDSISNIDFVFHQTSTFITQIINKLLDFSAEELNKKGTYYTVFIDVLDKLLLSLLNNLITSDLEPQFGATCLES
ncbi:hypothetical protein BBO99_00001793 [Phytophthora kernoviae]|uniref:Uncharacterized protein n=2 Tax=Phytophthora kernoviae TaxID=325452 RepID=A0A3R7G3A5_9STRA|nr:hypothetical protein G195_002573 [Phytophthora kernoviae 00238/432]KAG2526131.1 hypothetical protein JM16_004087 [Phytophthora kernoviae]KAG2532050.1 hypothetical protein JM18_001438 [Phytophthora kernoviae]RLN27169.1 hypothetical protein BBI17_001564 [Phytophthora kernoviae]RLN83824.1 hypothetical protein BBO99_00001793 [Phytophthora kernoviae]